jgi:hypothetical protein
MAHIGDTPPTVAPLGDGAKVILHRVVWGALGGVIATGSKFIAQDWQWYRIFKATRELDAIDGMISSYILLGAILCGIGAIVAAAFQGERHPFKLLGLGVAAPALVTTWLGGQYPGDLNGTHSGKKSWLPEITTSAFAADGPIASTSDFWKGAGIVFGIGKDQTRYRVVVGSYPSREQAIAMLERVRKVIPDAPVFTADPKPGNNFYGVVVGPELPFNEAQKLRDELSEKLNIKDTYLSRYPN